MAVGTLRKHHWPGDPVVLHRSCWPCQPHWHTPTVLILLPVPIALTRVARLSLQCRLIPHSSVISERSSSSNSSRLMSWVSLERAETGWSPTMQVAGRGLQGNVLPVGREQHPPPRERLSQSLLGRNAGKGAPSGRDGSVPTKELGLAWSATVGRQEECTPNQPQPDQSQQGCAGQDRQHSNMFPGGSAPSIPGRLWGCPSWAQVPSGAKAGVTGRGRAGGPGKAQLEDGPAGMGDHTKTHRPCRHSKPAGHGTTSPRDAAGRDVPAQVPAVREGSDFPLRQNHSPG